MKLETVLLVQLLAGFMNNVTEVGLLFAVYKISYFILTNAFTIYM